MSPSTAPQDQVHERKIANYPKATCTIDEGLGLNFVLLLITTTSFLNSKFFKEETEVQASQSEFAKNSFHLFCLLRLFHYENLSNSELLPSY